MLPKIDFPDNTPVHVELLYEDPIEGKSQHGDYWKYTVWSHNKEWIFFANDILFNKLDRYKKGDRVTITKTVIEGKWMWEVKPYEGKAKTKPGSNPVNSDYMKKRPPDEVKSMTIHGFLTSIVEGQAWDEKWTEKTGNEIRNRLEILMAIHQEYMEK